MNEAITNVKRIFLLAFSVLKQNLTNKNLLICEDKTAPEVKGIPHSFLCFCVLWDSHDGMSVYLPLNCRKHALNILLVMLSLTARSLIACFSAASFELINSRREAYFQFASIPIHNGGHSASNKTWNLCHVSSHKANSNQSPSMRTRDCRFSLLVPFGRAKINKY